MEVAAKKTWACNACCLKVQSSIHVVNSSCFGSWLLKRNVSARHVLWRKSEYGGNQSWSITSLFLENLSKLKIQQVIKTAVFPNFCSVISSAITSSKELFSLKNNFSASQFCLEFRANTFAKEKLYSWIKLLSLYNGHVTVSADSS